MWQLLYRMIKVVLGYLLIIIISEKCLNYGLTTRTVCNGYEHSIY